MATYGNGQLARGNDWYDNVPPAQTWDDVAVWQAGGELHASALPVVASGIIVTQPGYAAGTLHAGGQYAAAFSQDYYDRIHLNPDPVNVGNLLSNQTVDVEVWNAYVQQSKLLARIVAAGITDGISLIEPQAAPTLFAALESRTYQIQLATQGPAVIDVHYTFDFPDEDPVLEVTGQRVVVFAFPINWQRPLTERLEWRTDIQKTHGGGEYRRALRSRPRRSFEFEAYANGQAATVALDALLFAWQARTFAIPVWQDAQRSDVAQAAGAGTVSVDTAERDYIDGGTCILWRGHDAFETAQIQSVQVGSLTLVRPLAQSWPAGTVIAPVRFGRLQSTVNAQRITSTYGRLTARFEIEQSDTLETSGYVGETHDGYDVLPFPPNFIEAPVFGYSHDSQHIDYQTGVIVVDDPSDLGNIVMEARYLLRDKPTVNRFKQWLYRRKGKAVPALVRTWMQELTLKNTISDTGTALTIDAIGYDLYYQLKGGRNYFALQTLDGAWYYRRITAFSPPDGNGEHTLGYDLATGVVISPTDVRQFMFLQLSRLNTDAVEIGWETSEVANVSLPLRSIMQ